jgi:vacuolar-type H+-ATPase subunit B/Vma2
METKEETPRRNRLDLNTPAEVAIFNAMQEVEKAGADVRLTKAGMLLSQAKNLIADYIEGIDMSIDLPPTSVTD